jgi:hypothetical protein
MFAATLLRAVPLTALLACRLATDTGPPPPADAVRVLFIGNSLTYVNNLPRTVADLAVSAGLKPCLCVEVAYPDYALEDHYYAGDAANELHTGGYAFVVMQQGPSALPESRTNLVQWATVFGQLIAEAGGKPVMYGVWPSQFRSFDFPNVRASYRAAADAIDALFAPAGEAWQRAWQQDPTLLLYASDGLHPTPMGTYLAALVIFQRVYGRSPVGIQDVARVGGTAQSWSASLVRLLQEAAAAANLAEDQQ